MAPRFRTQTSQPPVAESAERLYDDLARPPGAPEALWAHQADVLRTYHAHHLHSPDVALELPTGAGKTVPGLLVAEWRRRSLHHRVLYACPTIQLARQTAAAAAVIDVRTTLLVGPHHTWSTAQKAAYESAGTLGITTYSAMFNAAPALEPAQTLVFDDAHAAEQYVAGSFSVNITRAEHPKLYQEVLELLVPALPDLAAAALPDEASDHRSIHLINAAHVRRVARLLASILAGSGGGDLYWRARMIGDRLDRCQVYVAREAILVRPILPPTGSHRHFTEAAQRLYLSATLGEGGELERSFGRAPIARLKVPTGWDSRGAGRRFFVFPDLHQGTDPRELAARVVAEAGKGLVLTPSIAAARAAADLAPDGTGVLGPDGKIEELLAAFRDRDGALLTLAQRYDGLDLPGAQCRLTVLDGMPTGTHLQERFLSETLLAGRVLRERQRTRVVQGAGRCARGLSDHSVVVILGDALTRFLTRPEVRDALRPEVQAEVGFGLDNADADSEEVLDFVRSFLAQDSDWLEQAEPELLKARRTATRAPLPDSAELATAAAWEVKAVAALWSGDWATASRQALEAAGKIRSAHLAGYRALWTYLAAAWLSQEAEDRDDDALRASAADLLRKAHTAGRGTTWLRQVQPLPSGERVLETADAAAVRAAVASGTRTLPGAKWTRLSAQLLDDLAQTSAARYENALSVLGGLLGAEAYRPPGKGRADCAWVWPEAWWLALEAKTEETPDALLSQETVRQTNDQLKIMADDRDQAVPDASAVVVISPRELVDPLAAVSAEPFVHLVTPATVLELARDTVGAWRQVRAQAGGMDDTQVAALADRVFTEHAVLVSDIRARLLADPVGG